MRLKLVAANPKLKCYLFLLGLIVFFLSPTLRTGYFSDDTILSLLPGALKVEGFTLSEYVAAASLHCIKVARLFPLQMVEIYTWFYVVQTPVVHKAMVIACVLLDLILFALLVRQVSKDAAFAIFATCMVFPLFQFRDAYDPILSYFGLLPVIAAGLLASLLALQVYLDTNRAAWLVLGAAAYISIVLMYEFNYPLFLLHLVLVAYGRRGWGARAVASLPFIAAGGLGFLSTAVLRWVFLGDNPALLEQNRINKDPVAFLATLARQTSSAFPMSHYLVNPAGLFPRIWDVGSMIKFMATAGGLAVFAGTLAACLMSLGYLPTRAEEQAGGRPGPGGWKAELALIGLLLGVLPAVLISVSARHQAMIRPGIGYTPVYLQYFGVGLVLAVGAWSLLSMLSPGGTHRRRARMAMAILVAATAGLTYRANAVVVDTLEKPHPYNPSTRATWGCWNQQRRNLESALRTGLLDEVPDHSVVLLANEYPGWHDHPHSRYFYAMHSGKLLETTPLASCSKGDYCWFLSKAGRKPHGPAMRPSTYLLRDVFQGEGDGYVVLSSDAARDGEGRPLPPGASGGGELRVYVRHPELFEEGRGPDLVITGQPPSPAGVAGGPRKVLTGRELTRIRSGRDWALFSLPAEAGDLDPNTLAVASGPVSASWDDGFYEPLVRRNEWRRWSDRRGVLTLNNATETPRKVKVSMLLGCKGKAPLLLAGGSIQTRVDAGSEPARFERQLTLAPGTNRVEIRSEGPPATPQAGDPRRLYFYVSKFKIEDLERK